MQKCDWLTDWLTHWLSERCSYRSGAHLKIGYACSTYHTTIKYQHSNVILCQIKNWKLQLGPNHVCVILSRRRDTITSVWYYVSHRRDTTFQAHFWQSKKYLQEVLSLELCLLIHFLNNVQFQNLFSPLKNKVSRLCDTLNGLEDQVSRRRDSITQRWYFDFLREKQFLKLDIVEKSYAFAKF